MSDPGVNLSLSTARRWANAVRRTEAAAVSTPAASIDRHAVMPGTHFRFQIAASPTRDGSNWRWVYAGTAKIKSSAGFAGWVDDPRFSAAITLRNTFERDNDASGIVSGYDLSDPAITGIAPIEAGLIVDAWFERFYEDDEVKIEWWFTARNQPIVTCPEAE